MTDLNAHRLRRLFIYLVLVLIASSATAKAAADKETAKAAAAAAAEAAAKERARLAAIEDKRKKIEAAKKKLNSTAWQVEVVQTNTKSKTPKKYNDTIRFIDDRVESQHLLDKGFTRTNYSVRVKESKIAPEGRIFWETMQTHPEGEQIAYWRGELEGESMRGVLSWHLNEKEINDFNFASTASKEKIDPAMYREEKPKPEERAPAPPAAKAEKPAEKEKAVVKAEEKSRQAVTEKEETKEAVKEVKQGIDEKESIEEAEAVKETVPEPEKKPEKKKRWGLW